MTQSVREREREHQLVQDRHELVKDRQADGRTDRQTDRRTHRQTDRRTDGHKNRKANIPPYREFQAR